MKAIILAAGMGTRMGHAVGGRPKCLLRIGQRTLLDRIAQSLTECGVGQAVLVVGFQRGLIESQLSRHPLAWRVVVNPDYACTNTIHSLWLARKHLDGDVLYFNADVLFDARIVRRLAEGSGNLLAVQTGPCEGEEVKVIVGDDGRIRRIGKDLDPRRCQGEFIGIGRFSRGACPSLVEALSGHVQAGRRELFFESALDDILDQHAFQALEIGDLPAIEIDDPEDLRAARAMSW